MHRYSCRPRYLDVHGLRVHYIDEAPAPAAAAVDGEDRPGEDLDLVSEAEAADPNGAPRQLHIPPGLAAAMASVAEAPVVVLCPGLLTWTFYYRKVCMGMD